MSGWPARALGVAAWVAVVAVGAVLVWLVISRAGAGLVADAGPVTGPTSAPETSDGSADATPGAPRRGVWQGESGVVTAVCRRGAIALVGAQPEDGVVVRVKDQGPEQLVVAFAGDDGPVTVVATCGDGRPQFRATTGSSGETSSPGPSGTATSEGSDDGGGGSGSGHGSGPGSDDGPSDAPGDH